MIDKTCFMMISINAKYLQATLSSKLFSFAYKKIFSSIKLGGNGYQYNKHALVELPVKVPNKEIETQIESLVSSEFKNPSAETEREIDSLVYHLYGLSQEEIAFIENQ